MTLPISRNFRIVLVAALVCLPAIVAVSAVSRKALEPDSARPFGHVLAVRPQAAAWQRPAPARETPKASNTRAERDGPPGPDGGPCAIPAYYRFRSDGRGLLLLVEEEESAARRARVGRTILDHLEGACDCPPGRDAAPPIAFIPRDRWLTVGDVAECREGLTPLEAWIFRGARRPRAADSYRSLAIY